MTSYKNQYEIMTKPFGIQRKTVVLLVSKVPKGEVFGLTKTSSYPKTNGGGGGGGESKTNVKNSTTFFVIKKQFEEIQIIDVQCVTNNYSQTKKLNMWSQIKSI